ncbi:MAG: ATP-dependent DNA helicase RecG [Clostridiales bacterium]|nr:ATP-dependent DNA helicase RecG [Clostridiales bacterium]
MELCKLKFISEKREKDFNKLGIYTVEEVAKHYPRDYLDMRNVTPVQRAYHNDVILTACEVLDVEVNRYSRRPFVKAMCQQGGYVFSAIWFNQMYVANKLTRGEYLFYGRVQNRYGMGATLVNPSFEPSNKVSNLKGLVPVYSLSGSLTQGIVRVAVKDALAKTSFYSNIPEQLCKKYSLMPLNVAYRKIHCPENAGDIKEASFRIAVEEYFLLVTAFKVIKGDRDDVRTRRYNVTRKAVEEFVSRFGFSFTQGQSDAVNAIYCNLTSPHNMNMLLQGDVGCGKTAVALAGIFMAVKSGYQAAMISPTEVLARQSAKLIEKYFPEYCVKTLTGSTPAAEKREIKKALASGEAHIVCGTHAVLQDDVTFNNLAFTVCDEQHRFGVAQRASLTQKGEGCDTLIMSATPIPRTLSLIFYGDLDITTIKDKPKARQEISTSIIPESKYPAMYNYVAEQAKLGNRTYIVCPKIEGDEEGTVMSVTEIYEELKAKMPSVRFALLHGKMKDKQKNEVMTAFKEGEYDCLVSTTVIEVGVDVPEATTMIIYNAERFGLSQLHQLRGRVGRGDKKSYCFLLMGADTPEARERLSVIKNSTDGFEIAEADLKMRGGGDFMGTRQSGRMMSEIKNLKFSVDAVFTAKRISDEAFSGVYDVNKLARIAAQKYESLKDVILN